MKNYFRYSFFLTLAVVVLMTALSLVVPGKVFGISLKQTNIYADVVDNQTIRSSFGLEGDPFCKSKNVVEQMNRLSECAIDMVDSIRQMQERAQQDAIKRREVAVPKGVVPIQDFSNDGYHLASFFQKLDNARGKSVRVAFLGDSFIEGDLVTSDVRSLFQQNYSGGGVGFVPITSQVAQFRATVEHKFSSNWQEMSIMRNQNAAKYMLSGLCFKPKSENAWVEYSGAKTKSGHSVFNKATLMFINTGATTIKAIINEGSREEIFTPEASDQLQSIVLSDSIYQIKFEFSHVEGFVAYGALLDNAGGVSVDNFSLRGHSGISLTGLNAELCGRMRQIGVGYDLIILEYGLNVVEENVTSYGSYRTQMMNVVEHVKRCFPDVPIVIMGVSDRSTMVAGEFVTMEGVTAMDSTQKDVAKRCQVTYWSTLSAMRSMGGMPKFVENGWAAKDYTHIGGRGGQKIARKLYDAIIANK